MEFLQIKAQRKVSQQPLWPTSASQIFPAGAIFLPQLWKRAQRSKSRIQIYIWDTIVQIILLIFLFSAGFGVT